MIKSDYRAIYIWFYFLEHINLSKEAVRRIGLQFDDIQLVPLLFGEHDCNLAQIEEELDIEILSRGNEVILVGNKKQLKEAQAVFDVLWDRLINDMPVTKSEISSIIQVASSSVDKGTRDMAMTALKEANVKVKSKKKTLNARTPKQAEYLAALSKSNLIFGIGPAGTGKTFLAVAKAVEMIQANEIDRIILCRPAVEAGESLGFLPGTMQEKVDPYLRPIYDALHDMMGAEQLARRLADGTIEIAPLAFMRGRTLSNSFIILDEAQNTTPTQMKMVLTRIGENSRIVVTGDITQTDLSKNITSGLRDAMQVLKGVKNTSFIEFDEKDVVRSGLARNIVAAYDKRDKK